METEVKLEPAEKDLGLQYDELLEEYAKIKQRMSGNHKVMAEDKIEPHRKKYFDFLDVIIKLQEDVQYDLAAKCREKISKKNPEKIIQEFKLANLKGFFLLMVSVLEEEGQQGLLGLFINTAKPSALNHGSSLRENLLNIFKADAKDLDNLNYLQIIQCVNTARTFLSHYYHINGNTAQDLIPKQETPFRGLDPVFDFGQLSMKSTNLISAYHDKHVTQQQQKLEAEQKLAAKQARDAAIAARKAAREDQKSHKERKSKNSWPRFSFGFGSGKKAEFKEKEVAFEMSAEALLPSDSTESQNAFNV